MCLLMRTRERGRGRKCSGVAGRGGPNVMLVMRAFDTYEKDSSRWPL
jgi:hypothetical protein